MRALITGVTGQDGWYLAQELNLQGYQVYGTYRNSSGAEVPPDVEPIPMEITEYESVKAALSQVAPGEVYNLAAQTHVGDSFVYPLYTSEVNYQGVLHILEAIRSLPGAIKLYQASTSEMFGQGLDLHEAAPFRPQSPYGVAKLAAHQLCHVYRSAYNMHISCGILFNHESPRRGARFVTRKICKGFARGETVRLGNIYATRDWGHAQDYVRAMVAMLQVEPDDFVIATGEARSVFDFCKEAVQYAPDSARWLGGHDEFTRPWDVEHLCGDASKARAVLGWEPEISFEQLVAEMMESELARLRVHATTETTAAA